MIYSRLTVTVKTLKDNLLCSLNFVRWFSALFLSLLFIIHVIHMTVTDFILSSVGQSSREWDYIDRAEKTRILQNSTDDGEFWWVYMMNLLQKRDFWNVFNCTEVSVCIKRVCCDLYPLTSKEEGQYILEKLGFLFFCLNPFKCIMNSTCAFFFYWLCRFVPDSIYLSKCSTKTCMSWRINPTKLNY